MRSRTTEARVLAVFYKAGDVALTPRAVMSIDPSLPFAYTPKLLSKLVRDGVLELTPEGYKRKLGLTRPTG